MTWIFTQQWNGVQPYSFSAEISPEGLITINGGFVGVMAPNPGTEGNVSLAIANFDQQTVAAYLGVSGGPVMHGTVTGTAEGNTVSGLWFATEIILAGAEKKEHYIPARN